MGVLGFAARALLCLACSVAAAPPAWIPFNTTHFKRHQTIYTPSNKPVELLWTLSDDLLAITIGVASNSSAGWLAVGFSETSGMKGADIALGYVNETSNQFVLEDRFTSHFVKPVLDDKQNLNLIGSWTSNSYIAFTFSRRTILADCSNKQDRNLYVAPNTRQNVLVAFGTSMKFEQHGPTDRGSALVDLHSSTDAVSSLLVNPPVGNISLIPFDVVSPPTDVPATGTAYCYSFFEAPTDAKYHVIQEIPVIQDPRVHHLIIYACDGPLTSLFNAGTPKVLCGITNPCLRFFAEWAPGIGNRTYPQEFAKPLGAGDLSARYLMLEVHYNQVSPTGFNDPGAGFRLMLSTTLRDNDLGILAIGMAPTAIDVIAAGVMTKKTYDTPSECTQYLSQSVTLNGVFLHMHKRGYAAEASIIRLGTNQTKGLVQQNYFDFNSQGLIPLSPTKINPGDRFLMTCLWDSRNETTPTSGGYSSDQEMCFGFLEYYPLQALQLGWRYPGSNQIFCPRGNGSNIISSKGIRENLSPDPDWCPILAAPASAAGHGVQVRGWSSNMLFPILIAIIFLFSLF
ncbi:PHM/PNGase F domain-containing protein [Cladochytrium replicatum]|nr:PHM/PNGase F domain-containing protein [Cladochytrium replicatum]